MRTLRGPSLHLAQFADDAAPFNSLPSIAQWAAGVGFKALQIPAWDGRLFDVETAAESQAYCDDMKGMLAEHGLEISELTTHIFGQLVAVHPAYDAMCDNFAPEAVRGNPAARTAWALDRLKLAARASRRLGLTDMGTFRVRSRGPTCFRSRNGPPASSRRLSMNWRAAGGRFSMSAMKTASTFATRSTPAKTCMTASASSVSMRWSASTRAARCCSIRAISCCSSWTISRTSISTATTSACFM